MENWCFFTSCQDQLVFSIALGPFGEADSAISFGNNPAVCPLWLRRSVDSEPAPRVSKGKHRRARSWTDLRHALPVLRSWQAVFGAICSASERWFSALDHSVIKDSIVFMLIFVVLIVLIPIQQPSRQSTHTTTRYLDRIPSFPLFLQRLQKIRNIHDSSVIFPFFKTHFWKRYSIHSWSKYNQYGSDTSGALGPEPGKWGLLEMGLLAPCLPMLQSIFQY